MEVNMTAEQLLKLIRRDIGSHIQISLQFKGGDHFAQNLKAAREVSAETEAWIDALIKDNFEGFDAGLNIGTREDWASRAQAAEFKLHRLHELAGSMQGILNE